MVKKNLRVVNKPYLVLSLPALLCRWDKGPDVSEGLDDDWRSCPLEEAVGRKYLKF